MRKLILAIGLIALTGSILQADLNGTYKGTWSSDNGGDGDLTLVFSPGASGAVTAQVSFTTQGETVKCDVKSITVDGSKLELVMRYEAGGNQYEATVSGSSDGKALSGTYRTKALTGDSQGDTGSWKATAV